MASLPSSVRARIIKAIGVALLKNKKAILVANQKDTKRFAGSEVMKERLELNENKIDQIAKALVEVANFNDPIGGVIEQRKLASGLLVKKVSVPMGVVGLIYESRPNVTVDMVALAIKSGNAIVLKGGSDASFTNQALVAIMQKVLRGFKLPQSALLLIDGREDWKKIVLSAHGLIDVLVPRGGQGLIDFVRENSKIPVIETGAGVCHIFADETAKLASAVDIVTNSKIQRPSACNAVDTLLVHKNISGKLLPALAKKLAQYGVKLLADTSSLKILRGKYPAELLAASKATDYGREFLSLTLAIKTVNSFKEGLAFVIEKTSGHSEAILSQNSSHIREFQEKVDAAVVYSNASLRFTDGGEFGLGAEVGVSTQKLHARGPMGAEALTTYKWVVSGAGQSRK